MEIHGATQWAACGHRYDEPGQPEVACIINGQLMAQSDCAYCAKNKRINNV